MRRLNAVTWCILTFTLGVLLLTLFYGPYRRVFVSPGAVHQVDSVSDINNLWQSNGVRGRVLVIFARHINPEHHGTYFAEYAFTTLSLRQGAVRTVYHIVPDRYWPEISFEKSTLRPDIRTTTSGFVHAFEAGRVYFLPLSRFESIDERALVILDAQSWGGDELADIYHLIERKKLRTDLMAINRCSPMDAELFRSVMKQAN